MSMVKLTGMWKAPKDKAYLASGQIGNVVFLLFKNDRKEKENDPTYNLCVATKAKPGEPEGKAEPEGDDLPF